MRLRELRLQIPGDEFRVAFHEELTVLSGIGILERDALVDSLIGAFTGTAEGTVVTYTDHAGRLVEVSCTGGRSNAVYLDDGQPAPAALDTFARDASALERLMLLRPEDLGLGDDSGGEVDPELSDARATLADLTRQLQAALTLEQTRASLVRELAAIDEQLSDIDDGAARQRYAKVLADLERTRTEAAALSGGGTGAQTDRHLLGRAESARDLVEHWRAAAERRTQAEALWGDRTRLDRDTIAEAIDVPEDVPVALEDRAADLARATKTRDEVRTVLEEVSASRLPEPSCTEVAQLARMSQPVLWDAHRRVMEAASRLDDEQVALGGLQGDGGHRSVVIEGIEDAHHKFTRAERRREQFFVPGIAGTGIASATSLLATVLAPPAAPILLATALATAGWSLLLPRRQVAAAGRAELAALEDAGAPTYLSFQMRRVDAVIDPEVRQRLEVAALEDRLARTAWAEAAGAIDIEHAALIRPEVEEYARALTALGGAADEIERLRQQLADECEPALAAAEEAVLAIASPFGVTDARLATEMVRSQVALGRAARLQQTLERAEAEEAALDRRLDEILTQLGFTDGDVESRVGAVEWALQRADEREAVRSTGRPSADVEADLARLETEARALARPEWASVTPADAEMPDPAALESRRSDLVAQIAEVTDDETDVAVLADRHSALERRVASLESSDDQPRSRVGQLADVQQYLLAHLTQAGHAGPDDEPVAVVLDELFLRLPAEKKWELLDMIRRLAENVQLIYLTDDPYIASWARRRAAAGLISLLEPAAA